MKAELPYVRRKRNLLFWEPTKAMRAKGFRAKPLGPETPEAIAEAKTLYESWLKEKARDPLATKYPPGTLGAFYERYRKTLSWADKAPRTREEYERTWEHIEPVLASKVVSQLTVEEIEVFSRDLEKRTSQSERHRTMKNLRALLSQAIQRMKLTMPNPARGVRNSQPKGRNQIWFGEEIVKLVKGADDAGYPNTALAILIAWETMFSLVDVWTLTRGELRNDGDGWYIAADREKTGKDAFGALSQATSERLLAYIASVDPGMPPEARILRQRNGQPYRSKDTFGDDFRAVRKLVFPGDTRQFMDIRRSANVEADAAGADKETMGQLLANNIASSAFLDATYTPPTVTKAREVAAKRQVGRDKLKAEVARVNRSNRGA